MLAGRMARARGWAVYE